MEVVTTHISVEMSKFVKQELHTLVNYMHSNLTNQQVASTINRHFTSRVSSFVPQLVYRCIA